MRTYSKNYRTRFALLALAPLAAACGNIGTHYAQTATVGSGSGSSSAYAIGNTTLDISADNGSNSNYTCPSASNVNPDYDYWHDGSDFYTVCTNTTSVAEVEIHGKTHTSSIVCAFAAQVINGDVYAVPDATTGLPTGQCADSSAGPVDVTFSQTYDALFIVEGGDQEQMQTCLIGGNYLACPHYSYGKFR